MSEKQIPEASIGIPTPRIQSILEQNGYPNFLDLQLEPVELSRPQEVTPGLFVKFRRLVDFGGEATSPEETAARIARSLELYAELRTQYDMPMPDVYYELGEVGLVEPKKPGYYRVSETIKGADLSSTLHDPNSSLRNTDVDHLYATLARYFQDKLKSGGEFVVDLHGKKEGSLNDQFVYGHREGEVEDRIYLVDQEPYYTSRIAYSPRGLASLTNETYQLFLMMQEAEEAREAILPQARQELIKLLRALPTEMRGYDLFVNGPLEDLQDSATSP